MPPKGTNRRESADYSGRNTQQVISPSVSNAAAKTMADLNAARAARDEVVANRAPTKPVVAPIEPALSLDKAKVVANNIASLASTKANTRSNAAPTGSLLVPDAGLFGTGSFGAAPELSAAVSTRPITPAQQQAFTSKIAPIAANNRAINAQNNTMYAGGTNTFDETAGSVSFPSNITPTVTTQSKSDTKPTIQNKLYGKADDTDFLNAVQVGLDTIADPERNKEYSAIPQDIFAEARGRQSIQGYADLRDPTEYAKDEFESYLKSKRILTVEQDENGDWWQMNTGGLPAENTGGNANNWVPAGPAQGPVGSYSIPMYRVPDDNSFLNNLGTVLGAVGMFVPGAQFLALASPLIKVATGQTLKTGDWANVVTGGLHASGMLTAPTKAAAATATTPAVAANAGKGLFEGVSYSQSIKGLNTVAAAAQGDLAGAAVSQFGEQLTRKALGGEVNLLTGKQGAEGAFLTDLKNNYNINSDDLIKGLVKSEKALVNGASLQDAVLQGVGKYVTEGGSLSLGNGGIQTPEILKKLEDVVRTVGSQIDNTILQPIKKTVPVMIEAAKEAVKPVGQAVSAVNEAVIEPVVGAAIDAGSAVNRGVVKPVVGAVGDVAKATGNVIQAVTEPVVDVVDDVLDSSYDAINQLDNFIDDIDMPNINLPNVNLPNINMPNVNYSGGRNPLNFNISGGGQPVPRASLMSNKKLDEIDLGFELEELERVKPFEPLEYNPRGMQAI